MPCDNPGEPWSSRILLNLGFFFLFSFYKDFAEAKSKSRSKYNKIKDGETNGNPKLSYRKRSILINVIDILISCKEELRVYFDDGIEPGDINECWIWAHIIHVTEDVAVVGGIDYEDS